MRCIFVTTKCHNKMILHVKTLTTTLGVYSHDLILFREHLQLRAKEYIENSSLPAGIYKFVIGRNKTRNYLKIYRVDNENDVKKLQAKYSNPINYVKSTLNFKS